MDVLKVEAGTVTQVWRNSSLADAVVGMDDADTIFLVETDQQNVSVGMVEVAGVFVAPLPTKDELQQFAGSARDRKVYGGIEFAGMQIPTDERTQQVLTAAYTIASLDPTYSIPEWKVGGEYVALSNEQIIAIATAVREHVQACFGLNKEVDQQIDAGTITDRNGVRAAFGEILP